MAFFKNQFFLIATLLIGGASFTFAGCESSASDSYGNLEIDQSLELVAADSQEVIFLTVPSPQNTPAQAYSPEAIIVDGSGEQTSQAVNRHSVQYIDSLTGETRSLNLISFESTDGTRWMADPASDTPPLLPNPQNPSQLLFQPVQNVGGLYLLNTETQQVTALGNHQAWRDAIARQQAQPPANNTETLLYWVSDATWSPDGRQIAFTSNRENLGAGADLSIWVLDVATGEEQKVIGNPGDAFRIAGWSADHRILALSYSQVPMELIALAPETGQKDTLVTADVLDFLALSEDHQTLLYEERPRRGSAETSGAKVYAFSLATGNQQLIFTETETQRLAGMRPEISDEGDRVVIPLNLGSDRALLVYNLATQETQQFPLPAAEGRLATAKQLAWAGDHLVVPLENPQDGSVSTLLMSVDPPNP